MNLPQSAPTGRSPEHPPPIETDLATAAPLHAIVYSSDAVMPLMVVALEQLHRHSVDSNRQHAITGVLLYDGGHFMQYIEGPQPALGRLYANIQADTRHAHVVELLRAPIAQRHFAQWHMGLAQATKSEVLALSTTSWEQLHAAPLVGPGDSPGLTLLRGFWQRQQA